MRTQLSVAAMLLAAPLALAGDIAWSPEYAAALERAAAESKVVFVAVNMDGESANDRLAEETYHASRIVELSGSTVNLIASSFEHSARTCSRFGGITCREHRTVDVAVRRELLKADSEGFVVAPQHVFLSPSGDVLLSAPYEVDAAELEWCFVTALREVDPAFEWKLAKDARPPRRLILGGVLDPGAAGSGPIRPVSREEALELIAEVKRGVDWQTALEHFRRIVTCEDEEALDFTKTQLRSGWSGGGGGGRRGGAGQLADRRRPLLRAIGAYAAPCYWEIVADYADSSDDEIRLEAVVALEQLGAPESARLVQKLWKKDDEPEHLKDWYRALASTGPEDARVRRILFDAIEDEDTPDVARRNAVFALGYLVETEEVTARLRELVAGDDLVLRACAALALGMTRNGEHGAFLRARLVELYPEEAEREPTDDVEPADEPLDRLALRSAVRVTQGGSLGDIRRPVRQVTLALNPRPRIFGFAKPGD